MGRLTDPMKGQFQFSLRQFLIGTTTMSLLLVWTVSVWTRLLSFDLYAARDAGFENTLYESFANVLAWSAVGWWAIAKIVAYISAQSHKR